MKDQRKVHENRDDKVPDQGRRRFVAAGAAVGAAALTGKAFAALDLDGREGVDQPGERTAEFGSTGPVSMRMPQGWRGMNVVFYEMSANDPDFLEIYGYSDALSYRAGDVVKLHISTTAPRFSLEIYRDGPQKEVVYQRKALQGRFTETPVDAYMNGCGWPVLHEIKVDGGWRSGFYIVLLTVEKDGETKRAEAGFVVRGIKKKKIAYLLTTNTWQAYNSWGGANHYWGIHGEKGDANSPILSFQRPWERGFVVAPPNFPYQSSVRDRMRLEQEADFSPEGFTNWAFMMGYSAWASSAGWAVDNRPFAIWAEENGYEMDYLAQTDLDQGAEVLRGYDLVVISGHDEYWSWDQRDAMDSFVEAGGRLARFGANMLWQVRIDDGRQVCYKDFADEFDPVRNDPKRRHLLTGIWEHRLVGRPSAQTFGVTGLQGIYAATTGGAPRSHAGFTVYRPDHWVFEKTGLFYGDAFGTREGIVGYEIDSVDYIIEYGLPRPSALHTPLPGTQILALTPGTVDQFSTGTEGDAIITGAEGDYYVRYYARSIEGREDAATLDKYRYGSAQIVVAPQGRGEVFCAGTVYWFLGLKWRNRTVEQITHNVLRRYTKSA